MSPLSQNPGKEVGAGTASRFFSATEIADLGGKGIRSLCRAKRRLGKTLGGVKEYRKLKLGSSFIIC